MDQGKPASGSLGLAALVSIGIGGMVGGGIFSVLGLTVLIAGGGAYVSFVVGGVVAALTGWSYALLSVRIRSRGGTAVFLDRAFGTRCGGPAEPAAVAELFRHAGPVRGRVRRLPGGAARPATGRAVAADARQRGGGRLRRAQPGRGAAWSAAAEAVLVYFKLAVLLVFCVGGLAFVVTPPGSAPAAFPSAGAIVYAGRADLPGL